MADQDGVYRSLAIWSNDEIRTVILGAVTVVGGVEWYKCSTEFWI